MHLREALPPAPCAAGFLAFGCQDGQVGVFDTRTQHALPFPVRHQGPVLQLAWLGPAAPASPAQPSELGHRTGESAAAGAAEIEDGQAGERENGSAQVPEGSEDASTASAAAEEPATAACKASKKIKEKAGATGPPAGWVLMSLGGEGRLLQWEPPCAEDFAATMNPLVAGAAGGRRGGRSSAGGGRGLADRAGRWGHAAPGPAPPGVADPQLTRTLHAGSFVDRLSPYDVS
jgi:hypothetical protein